MPGAVSGESETFKTPENPHSTSQQLFNSVTNSLHAPARSHASSRAKAKSRNDIKILTMNVQSLRAHKAELEFHLDQLRPHVVMLQDTWLDKSVESPSVSSYIVVSRRDRSDAPNRGGILRLVKSDFNNLAFVEDSGIL